MQDADNDDDLPLSRHPTEDELAQAIDQAIAQGINKDEVAVAVTRDGRIYTGRAMPYKYPRLSKASSFFFHKFLFPIFRLLRHPNARSK